MFAVEKVDKWFQQSSDVLAAVVAELHQEVKQPQHLVESTTSGYRNGSQRPHRCCRLANNVEYVNYRGEN